MNKDIKGKLHFLDSIRGLMAINVILCHFICVYYPEMYFENYAEKFGGVLSLFSNTPLSVLCNGGIAVQYFFVLTGFLVWRSTVNKKISVKSFLIKIVNRYIRLLPIILVATVFTYLTMIFGLQYHIQISSSVKNVTFLTDYCNFIPTIKNLLLNIFIKPFIRLSDYVGPFWTIKYEFIGYIFSLLTCCVLKKFRFRRIAYIVVAIAITYFYDTDYMALFVGIFIADIYYCRDADTTYFSKYYNNIIYSKYFITCCFALGTYFACCPMYFKSIYKFIGKIPLIQPSMVRTVGISLVMYSLLHSNKIQKFLENKILNWMGKISYSVYAMHWPLMLSLEAGLFKIFYDNGMSYNQSANIAFIITLPVIYAVSYLVWRFFEKNKRYDIRKVLNRKNKIKRSVNK